MKKKYELPEENHEADKVNEPAGPFNTDTEMTFSPPLTEEELENALTTEQVKEHLHEYIHKLFNSK